MPRNRNPVSQEDKCQKYLHPFDCYSKPVQLTYNQQKTQSTIPGSLCTIISAALLMFYIMTNLVKYTVPEFFVYFHSNSQTLIAFNDPQLFDVDID